MTRHENILSFDEARARGSVSSQSSSRQPAQARSTVSRASQNGHRSYPAQRSTQQPQRLTYDPTFEQSFTQTPRSGSYNSSSRSSRTVPSQAAYRAQTPSVASRSVAQAQSTQRARNASAPSRAQDRNRSARGAERASNDKKSLTHRVRSAKAERQFNKTFGSDEPVKPGPEQSSRPALYEMKMGKSHKRSSRMQNNAQNKKRKGLLSRIGSVFAIFNPRSSRFSSRALITCATFLLGVVLLYNPVANYYQEVRQQQQLEAEYALVADYYSNLKSEVEYLNTTEGMEEYVREELGWVKAGEQVVTVEGLAPRDETTKKDSITADLSSAVPTPETWYSPVLDVVFGYDKA